MRERAEFCTETESESDVLQTNQLLWLKPVQHSQPQHLPDLHLKNSASLPRGYNRKQGHRARHEGSRQEKKQLRESCEGNAERETKTMKAGRKSSSRGSGDGGGNELFSLLPAASGATDQTQATHGFISYAEEANSTSHSNVEFHRSEGVVFVLFVVSKTSLKHTTVQGKKPEGEGATGLAEGI